MDFKILPFILFISWSSTIFGFEIISHRGASGVAPENTMSAVMASENAEADYIEVDVHLTKDNHVVALHDKTVDRTTDGTGSIRSLTLAEVKQLDAGSWFSPEFSQEKIPTLEEIFIAVGNKTKIIIELKLGNNDYIGIEQQIVDLTKKYKLEERVIVKSFDTKILNTFEKIAPLLPRLYVLVATFGHVTIDNKLRIRNILSIDNVEYYQVHKIFICKRLVNRIHAAGKKIIAWGVKPGDENKMEKMGVDIIEVDFPEYFRN